MSNKTLYIILGSIFTGAIIFFTAFILLNLPPQEAINPTPVKPSPTETIQPPQLQLPSLPEGYTVSSSAINDETKSAVIISINETDLTYNIFTYKEDEGVQKTEIQIINPQTLTLYNNRYYILSLNELSNYVLTSSKDGKAWEQIDFPKNYNIIDVSLTPKQILLTVEEPTETTPKTLQFQLTKENTWKQK